MILTVADRKLEFLLTPLDFSQWDLTNLFAEKNDKTVSETLAHRRYKGLARETQSRFPGSLNEKLGVFLYGRKLAGDPFYRRFLNKHGDGRYCKFTLGHRAGDKGIYVYVLDGVIKYIGLTTRTFKQRIYEYGTISPKKCYLDGQSTNCHLNILVHDVSERIQLHVCPLQDDADITAIEGLLIRQQQPEWNIALKNG